MATTLQAWLIRLGNDGAARNAASACASRRAAEARAEALVRRFNHPATQSVTTPLRLNTTNPAA